MSERKSMVSEIGMLKSDKEELELIYETEQVKMIRLQNEAYSL
jgi:hypothetical protein